MSKSVRRITGTLVRDGGGQIPVSLEVTTVALHGNAGVEEEAIARVELLSSDIPDGDYVLEYFCFKPQREPLRVKYGVLGGR